MCDFVIWVCEVRWWCWWWWYDYVWVKFLSSSSALNSVQSHGSADCIRPLYDRTFLPSSGSCPPCRGMSNICILSSRTFHRSRICEGLKSLVSFAAFVFKTFSQLTQFPRQLQCHAKRRMQFWEISNLDDRNRHELARCSLNMNGWRSGWRFRRNSRRDSAVECGNFQWKSD